VKVVEDQVVEVVKCPGVEVVEDQVVFDRDLVAVGRWGSMGERDDSVVHADICAGTLLATPSVGCWTC
jgi:hypothetical protein